MSGVETLRRERLSRSHTPAHTPGAGTSAGEKSPLIAFLLGLIPGLGAAYNGQNVKALVHFVALAGLWTMADIFPKPLGIIFALGSIAFYFYSLFDAWRSAQRQRAGEDLQIEDEQVKQFLRERTNVWGGLLIIVGALAVLNTVFPYQLNRFWPFLLILGGFYLLRGFFSGHRDQAAGRNYRTPPPSVIGSTYDRSTNDLAGAEGRYER